MALSSVQADVATACVKAGRDTASVSLIAVSKVQPLERVVDVLDQGHRIFGENRVQEAAGKWPALRERYDDLSVHLIGPLQTNKVRQALEIFDAIHTVDRDKLARRIADAFQSLGRSVPCFVQVNTGEEPQKAGCLPDDADQFIQTCRTDYGIEPAGLMCIPPIDEEPSMHFALLAKIAQRNGVPGLSMGMSGDYGSAIGLGATHIRVGSAIFGARVSPQDQSVG